MARAEASAEHEQHHRVVGNAEHRPCPLRASRSATDARTGLPVTHDFRRVGDVFARLLVGQGPRRGAVLPRNLFAMPMTEFCSCIDKRHAERGGRKAHGNADISAESHHGIGRKFPHPALRLARRRRRSRRGGDKRPGLLAIEARRLEGDEFDARLGHQPGLDACRRAREDRPRGLGRAIRRQARGRD